MQGQPDGVKACSKLGDDPLSLPTYVIWKSSFLFERMVVQEFYVFGNPSISRRFGDLQKTQKRGSNMAKCFEQKVLATVETFEPADCIKIVTESWTEPYMGNPGAQARLQGQHQHRYCAVPDMVQSFGNFSALQKISGQ